MEEAKINQTLKKYLSLLTCRYRLDFAPYTYKLLCKRAIAKFAHVSGLQRGVLAIRGILGEGGTCNGKLG